MFSSLHRGARLAAVLLLACCSLAVQAQGASPGWAPLQRANDTRSIEYAATVPLLGKLTPVTIRFYCNPKTDKDGRGALGFDVTIKDVSTLKPFKFDDFEGPDSATRGKNLMRVAVARKNKPDRPFNVSPSGWVPDTMARNFAFGVSAESRLANSAPRAILQALGDEADILHIRITDPRNPRLLLEWSVPVDGKQADFKALLAGL